MQLLSFYTLLFCSLQTVVNAWLTCIINEYLFNWICQGVTDAPKGGICIPVARDSSSVVWGWKSKLVISVLALNASPFALCLSQTELCDWEEKAGIPPLLSRHPKCFSLSFQWLIPACKRGKQWLFVYSHFLVNMNMNPVPNITKVHVRIS